MSVSLRPRAIHDENATRGSGAMLKPASGKGLSARTPMASVTKGAPATTLGGKSGSAAPRRALGDISNAQAPKPSAAPLKPTSIVASVKSLQSKLGSAPIATVPVRKVSAAPIKQVQVLPALGAFDDLDDWADDLAPAEVARGSGILAEYRDEEVEAASRIANQAAAKGASLFSLARPSSPIMWQGGTDDATAQDALLAAQLAGGPFDLDGIDDFDLHF